MLEEIKKIEDSFLQEIEKVKNLEDLEVLRIRYLGRKSFINQAFSRIPKLERNQRAELGRALNTVKKKIAFLLDEKRKTLSVQEKKIDLTVPSFSIDRGIKHILTRVNDEICSIFEKLGFIIIEGKEIEDEWHNFEALNIPLEHPSRDVFDTFYLDLSSPSKEKRRLLLRSHTSPSQIRVMEKMRPPLAVISPGRVYRPDKVDASHSFMFHQVEGFCVDRNINFSHLKGVLFYFARSFFSPQVKLRFRPHYFPFTEPSAEVDLGCILCEGKGCSVCSYKGWVEILGCGMIHPKVLKACKINPKEYQGFAFGMGVERIAMLKYRINDIRLFFENDLRFLEQFYEV